MNRSFEKLSQGEDAIETTLDQTNNAIQSNQILPSQYTEQLTEYFVALDNPNFMSLSGRK
jgi:hypothetical protein